MKHACILTGALLFGFLSELRAQSDSLVDVFPLAIGNQWTYRYCTYFGRNSFSFEEKVDSGFTTLYVIGKIPTTDSTRWLFSEQRSFRRYHVIDRWDTTYAVRETLAFELIESHQGHHQLYRADSPTPSVTDVLPFQRDYDDTTMVTRYRRIGPFDTTMFKSKSRNSGWPTSISLFTFRLRIGLVRYQYDLGVIDLYRRAHHFLLSQTLVSVGGTNEMPTTVSLSQNYPNPFNPTTRIEYAIPKTSHVKLKVFDVMGREVATLVDEVQGSGFKSVQFNASELASGVYLYRLQADGFVFMKKLMVIR